MLNQMRKEILQKVDVEEIQNSLKQRRQRKIITSSVLSYKFVIKTGLQEIKKIHLEDMYVITWNKFHGKTGQIDFHLGNQQCIKTLFKKMFSIFKQTEQIV